MNKNIVTLRALAIIIVVLGHSIIIYDPSWAGGVYAPEVDCRLFEIMKRCINIIQMPLFFSLSGYLFYFSVSKYSFIQVVRKKFKRLIIPYFSIALLWMNPIKICLKVVDQDSYLSLFREQIIGNMNGHLWFLYTLFALFLIFKLLYIHHLIGNRNSINELLVLGVLFVCNIYSWKFGPFSKIASYSLFFYLSFLINEYSHSILNAETEKNIIQYGIIGALSVIVVLAVFYCLDIISYRLFYCLIACVFLIIVYQIDFKSLNDNRFLNLVSSCSFGIYLFHSPLVYITYTYWRDINPLFVFLINFVLFGSLSLFLTMLVKKSRMKFIIGE